jgi:PIN domain nuclease of toxin-antitoxin system
VPGVIVLDTHLWFWLINEEHQRFPEPWKEAIERAEVVGVSPVSCFELALASQKGRLLLPCSAREWIDEALEPSGIALLPLTPVICVSATELSAIHRDPFDRLIMATALERQARLASVDALINSYPETQAIVL